MANLHPSSTDCCSGEHITRSVSCILSSPCSVSRTIRLLVGGRVRAILSGGAPLSEATHDYLRNVLGVILLQGYGLTETNACATVLFIEIVNN